MTSDEAKELVNYAALRGAIEHLRRRMDRLESAVGASADVKAPDPVGGGRMSEEGRAFLTMLEGSRRDVYNDPAGLPTIGVGHLLTPSERTSGKIYIDGEPVYYREGLTHEQVDALLAQDLRKTEAYIATYASAPLAQHERDALISFVFNIGPTAFMRSTLLKRLNADQRGEVPEEMRRWVYASGKRLRGLEKRREMEGRLFAEGDYGSLIS